VDRRVLREAAWKGGCSHEWLPHNCPAILRTHTWSLLKNVGVGRSAQRAPRSRFIKAADSTHSRKRTAPEGSGGFRLVQQVSGKTGGKPVHGSPFLHQAQCPRRQFAVHYGKALDLDRRLELTIASVKMRRRVLVVKHTLRSLRRASFSAQETRDGY